MTTPKTSVRKFVTDLAERAVKTAAQTAIATFGGAQLDIWNVSWHTNLGIVAGATILSVLSSLASSPIGDDTASLVK